MINSHIHVFLSSVVFVLLILHVILAFTTVSTTTTTAAFRTPLVTSSSLFATGATAEDENVQVSSSPSSSSPSSSPSSDDNNNNIGNANAYATHWENLLTAEYREAAEELKVRRSTWSRQRLEESGLSIFDANAMADTELYGEKIVRISSNNPDVGRRWRDLFSRGDILVLSPLEEDSPSNRRSFSNNNRNMDTQKFTPRECCVMDVGTNWLTLGVGPSWPAGLWETRRRPGNFLVRLDRTAPQSALMAQRKSLQLVRNGLAGDVAAFLANTFYSTKNAAANASKMPKRFTNGVYVEDLNRKRLKIEYEKEKSLDVAIQKALVMAKEASVKFVPNPSQEAAIAWALARRVSLVRGPPGTGKTRVAALLISVALRLHSARPANPLDVIEGDRTKGSAPRVLAVAHSNGAADVLVEALLQVGVPAVRAGRPASVSPNVRRRTVVAMAETHPEVVALYRTARDPDQPSHIRSAANANAKQVLDEIRQTITETAPVIVTSCIGAHQLLVTSQDGSSSSLSKSKLNFPIVVLDEAAQTTEPALVCALTAAKAEQVILVGDTQQLPPTVASQSSEIRASLGFSPMARLEESKVGEKTLQVQYRMPPALLEHPSKYFYNGLVTCAEDATSVLPLLTGFPWPESGLPLAFINVGGGTNEVTHNFGGKSNPIEAELVTTIISNLLKGGDVGAQGIAVISPYARQVDRIRGELSQLSRQIDSSRKVRVGTVDSFQGQETEAVIFSAVRSNPLGELGFLRDPRRLCVAITRARRCLILLGDETSLRNSKHWAALLDSLGERDCYLNAEDVLVKLDEFSKSEESAIENAEDVLAQLDEFL